MSEKLKFTPAGFETFTVKLANEYGRNKLFSYVNILCGQTSVGLNVRRLIVDN